MSHGKYTRTSNRLLKKPPCIVIAACVIHPHLLLWSPETCEVMHRYRAFHPREIKLEGKYSESRPALLCTCGEIARDKGRVCRRACMRAYISVLPWQRIYSRWHVRVAQPLKTYQSIPLARHPPRTLSSAQSSTLDRIPFPHDSSLSGRFRRIALSLILLSHSSACGRSYNRDNASKTQRYCPARICEFDLNFKFPESQFI